jgi:hypothetical protein
MYDAYINKKKIKKIVSTPTAPIYLDRGGS